MIVLNKINRQKFIKKSVIAIGNFDGVHRGHQKVLSEAKKKAKANKVKLGILSFEPVPVMFLKKIKNHRINLFKQKIQYLYKNKVDFLFIKKFNKNFRNLHYLKFIENIISKTLQSRYVFVSKNFRFGKNREGDINKLRLYEKRFGYETYITKPLKINNKIISSTRIRNYISKGKIRDANLLLGREWSVIGKVIKGNQRGRKIGFPTCNLKLDNYIIPKLGVYSVNISSNSFNKKKGIANIGYRPTFNGKSLVLEVNIFGINKNLYKKELKIDFIKFLRPERKFKDMHDLKKQIKIDIIKSKRK